MRKLFSVLAVTLVMVAFQNCGRVQFDAVDSGLNKTGFVQGPEVEDVIIDKQEDLPIVDVVIDTEQPKTEEPKEVVEDKKDDVVVVVDDTTDKEDEEKKSEDKKDDVAVVDDGDDEEVINNDPKDKKDDTPVVVDDGDKKNEEKKEDTLTDEEVELIACASDQGGNEKKVLICHYPPGNADARKTLCIGRSALKAHQHHGGAKDTLGACADESLASAD